MDIDTRLRSFARFGVRLGLESSFELLARLGNPHHRVPIVHVAGSNGKGSVCAYIAAVLAAAGYRVGRYTSPHLVDWCERISLNDQPIAPTVLHSILDQVIAAISTDGYMPSQFEVVTAAAWLYFAEQQVDIAVIEVGLGGRLDATNVCDRPLVSVITSISREHWQRLGPTLADIAREKAGILKPGCPAVIGELPEEARIAVQERVIALGCPATWVTVATYCAGTFADGSSWAEYGGLCYPLPLQGDVQLSNSAVAIAAIEALRQQGWVISDEAVVQGMAATRWPGRMQWMTWQKRQLLIDGAHNPAGAAGLRQFVDSQQPLPRSVHWVIGMMVNKDHADILGALLRPGDRLALVPVPDHNSADLDKLATIAWQVCPDLSACQPYEQLTLALDAAIATSLPNHLVVLCGSLYLIGHFLAIAEATHRQSSDVTG